MFTKITPPPAEISFNHPTRKLRLARSRPNHASDLMEALNESLTELKAYMPWAHFKNTVDSQTARLGDLEQKWEANQDFTFSLFLPQNEGKDRFVGCIGMHLNCLSESGVEIGYWVRSSQAGKGLCTLATQLLIYSGFEYQKLSRIQITCDVGNIGSKRVIEKVGFPYEGTLRYGGYSHAPQSVIDQGWKATGHTNLYALTFEDYPKLSWIDQIKESITLGSFTSLS